MYRKQTTATEGDPMLDPNDIRQARYALSLSQHELARRACVSRTALNQFEQGLYKAGPNFCRKLRDYFETAGIPFEVWLERPLGRRSVADRHQHPLAHNPAQALANTPDEADPLEGPTSNMPGPLEIAAGLALSLILGRRAGF